MEGGRPIRPRGRSKGVERAGLSPHWVGGSTGGGQQRGIIPRLSGPETATQPLGGAGTGSLAPMNGPSGTSSESPQPPAPDPGGGWTEIRVDAPNGWHELVGEALALGPCTTVVLGTTSIHARQPAEHEDAVRTFVAASEDTPELRSEIEGRLRALSDLIADPELGTLIPRYHPLPPEDYATSWRKDWKPYRVGHLVLLPPWCKDAPPRPTDRRLTIAPGGSFGSGRHATTRTCLRMISQRIQGGERVLDAGTGSGVLSVASALMGAESTLGFDIDPCSAEGGTELAAINGVQAACTFRTGDFGVLKESDAGFDVVFANIYADVLQAEMPNLASRLAPDGWFAFSGCRYDHRDPTVEAMGAAGLVIDVERQCGRWITFVGRHR